MWADLLSSQDLQQPEEMCVGRIPESTTGLKNQIIPWENTGMTPAGSNPVSPTAFLRVNLKLSSLLKMPLVSVTAVNALLRADYQTHCLDLSN